MRTCVVTLVHGTWGRGVIWPSGDAPWTTDQSPLCNALKARFESGLVFRRYRWSGGNSHTARFTAAEGLRRCLHRGLKEYPDATHIVVAHSHGGNVALLALAENDLRERIAGVACLATPFISARKRDIGSDSVWTFAGAILVLVVAIVAILDRWLPVRWSDLARTIVDTFVGVSVVSVCGVLVSPARRWADRLRQVLTPALPERDRLLIVRSPADEASGVIGFFQFISETTVRVFLVVEGWYQRFRRAAARWASHTMILIAVGLLGWLIVSAGLIAYIRLTATDSLSWGVFAVWFFLMGVCTTPLLVALRFANEDALPFMFLLLKSALVWPVIVILSALLVLPFGWQVAVANIFLDVTSDPTPIGSWEMHLVEPSTSHELGVSVPPLTHMVYENSHAHELLADWIASRLEIAI